MVRSFLIEMNYLMNVPESKRLSLDILAISVTIMVVILVVWFHFIMKMEKFLYM